MKFSLVQRGNRVPSVGVNIAYLHVDLWNDYSFVTMFYLTVFDEKGNKHEIGNVKIGFIGQTVQTDTYKELSSTFELVPDNFFSISSSTEYYKSIHDKLSRELKSQLLNGLNDLVYKPELLEKVKNEEVFGTSLLRSTSMTALKGQFARVLNGQVELTPFDFSFTRERSDKFSELEMSFSVSPGSIPRSNIHTIIGRNGVGKTTLLNAMISSVINDNYSAGGFEVTSFFQQKNKIESDFFSSIVSVSFTIFDPFDPPKERSDPSKGTCYFYLGLKGIADEDLDEAPLKKISDLNKEFVNSLMVCFIDSAKRNRWLNAIKTLESDDNFADMNLKDLANNIDPKKLPTFASKLFTKMSSGHAIVLLTITKLVEKVEEKTLVIIDEPESHLHPPLLSAFIRALSNLLFDRNGLAIIATHSPVILQEVPKSCVWKMIRSRTEVSCNRPDSETFGENVGALTREIFGLEVIRSGFHNLIADSVSKGGTYQDILEGYSGQLGFEGKAILKALVVNRDKAFN